MSALFRKRLLAMLPALVLLLVLATFVIEEEGPVSKVSADTVEAGIRVTAGDSTLLGAPDEGVSYAPPGPGPPVDPPPH